MHAVAVSTTRSKRRNRTYVAPVRNTVLNTIAENGPATAEQANTSASYLTELESQGLVKRQRDRKGNLVTERTGKRGRPAHYWLLTNAGRKRVQRARAKAQPVEQAQSEPVVNAEQIAVTVC